MCCKFGLSLLGSIKMKVLQIVCRLAVAEGKLRRAKLAEGRHGFLCSGTRQKGKDSVFFSLRMSHNHNMNFWNSWRSSGVHCSCSTYISS